jgi:hypothetical protein
MSTYAVIQSDVKKRFGRSIKTCWIAHVKELNGVQMRHAPNRIGSKRKYPCPGWARPLIEDSLRRYGDI